LHGSDYYVDLSNCLKGENSGNAIQIIRNSLPNDQNEENLEKISVLYTTGNCEDGTFKLDIRGTSNNMIKIIAKYLGEHGPGSSIHIASNELISYLKPFGKI
jgi:hypothetical protein